MTHLTLVLTFCMLPPVALAHSLVRFIGFNSVGGLLCLGTVGLVQADKGDWKIYSEYPNTRIRLVDHFGNQHGIATAVGRLAQGAA